MATGRPLVDVGHNPVGRHSFDHLHQPRAGSYRATRQRRMHHERRVRWGRGHGCLPAGWSTSRRQRAGWPRTTVAPADRWDVRHRAGRRRAGLADRPRNRRPDGAGTVTLVSSDGVVMPLGYPSDKEAAAGSPTRPYVDGTTAFTQTLHGNAPAVTIRLSRSQPTLRASWNAGITSRPDPEPARDCKRSGRPQLRPKRHPQEPG
jgi:hypothetical protein